MEDFDLPLNIEVSTPSNRTSTGLFNSSFAISFLVSLSTSVYPVFTKISFVNSDGVIIKSI